VSLSTHISVDDLIKGSGERLPHSFLICASDSRLVIRSVNSKSVQSGVSVKSKTAPVNGV
jgi:hypothetical protein